MSENLDSPLRSRRSPSTAAAIAQVAAAPAAPVWVALGWAVFLWVASQLPQIDAPLLSTDGHARGDLLAVASLGLDQLFNSALAWLLTGATAVVGVARLTLGRSRPPMAIVVHREPRQLADHAADVLRGRSARSSVRVQSRGADEVWLSQGHPRLVLGLSLLGLLVTLAGSLTSAVGAPSVRIVAAVDAAPGPLSATVAEAGRWVPAPGRHAGACQSKGQGLACQIDLPGRTIQADVAPGAPARLDGLSVTWIAQAPSAAQNAFQLAWPSGVQGAAPVLFDLQSGQIRDAKSLEVRMLPFSSAETGPGAVAIDLRRKKAPALVATPALTGPGGSVSEAWSKPQAILLVERSLRTGPWLVLGLSLLALAWALAARSNLLVQLRPAFAGRTEVWVWAARAPATVREVFAAVGTTTDAALASRPEQEQS